MTAPTHLDLLAAAAAVREAAAADDVDRLHTELTRLRNDFVRHLHGEDDGVSRLPGAVPEVVRHGHQRLLRLLDDLLFAAGVDAEGCACLVRSADLEQRLRRQARLEATLLTDHESS